MCVTLASFLLRKWKTPLYQAKWETFALKECLPFTPAFLGASSQTPTEEVSVAALWSPLHRVFSAEQQLLSKYILALAVLNNCSIFPNPKILAFLGKWFWLKAWYLFHTLQPAFLGASVILFHWALVFGSWHCRLLCTWDTGPLAGSTGSILYPFHHQPLLHLPAAHWVLEQSQMHA